ncbi:hypothetical protein GCM10022403_075730 [Streptomyces coacervatus]|uniref:ABC transporter domain-containing protein n=1 Tax=Streptomyces coacervatus TaxID=647381 RepID=A0ABP7J042_9ACTN
MYAVDGVDLDVRRGELTKPQVKALRRRIQIVFQDPMASLDPRMPVGDIVAEPLRTHGADRSTVARRVPELLTQAGLDPAHADCFPHEFSGGRRQRIGIARALSVEPELLVLDEPVSALGVSVQAGVLELLQCLKEDLGLAYLFVSHDLLVVRNIADRVSVVYLGRTVEAGPVDEVFERPRHPSDSAGRRSTEPDPPLRRLPLPPALPAVRLARRGGAGGGARMMCRSSRGMGWPATSRAYGKSSEVV